MHCNAFTMQYYLMPHKVTVGGYSNTAEQNGNTPQNMSSITQQHKEPNNATRHHMPCHAMPHTGIRAQSWAGGWAPFWTQIGGCRKQGKAGDAGCGIVF